MTKGVVGKTRAIIVDDERLAIRGIEMLLRDFPFVHIIGGARSLDEAVHLIETQAPDLIFLDIQLQGETGFDLFERAQLNARVVFVTAYYTYAIRAFEVNALDYLLKPVSRKRFGITMDRILRCNKGEEDHREKYNYDDVLALNTGHRMRFVKVDRILSITAEGDYTRVCMIGTKDELVLKSMKAWEALLPLGIFARIHRSAIINMERVHKIEKTTSNRFVAYLPEKSTPLPMSQRYSAHLRKKLNHKVVNIDAL